MKKVLLFLFSLGSLSLSAQPMRALAAKKVSISGVTNLYSNTSAFDNGYWNKYDASISVNEVNGPTGTLTADGILATSTSSIEKYLAKGPALAAGNYCVSFYVKAGAVNYVRLWFQVGTKWNEHYFNLTSGTVSYDNSWADSGVWGIIDAGGGWWRIWSACNMPTGTTSDIFIQPSATSGSGASVYAAANTTASQIFVWGAQLETGLTPGTYTAN